MDMDEDDFVFYGTPIEREEEITSRKKKAVAEASGQLRSLPSWKQEVRDEEGRRRFHGAFTGGFSAGYYNTAGSKEGWTPQSFTSSRKNRAEAKQQSIFNFLDDDEKAEIEGRSLGTSLQFDTFGFTAAEVARKQAEKEHLQRPSAIPGPVPDEIVVPATESVGVKLLLKMGWRHGHSIQDSRSNSLYDARREARKAFLALSSDDSKAPLDGPEPVESNIDNINEQTGDGDIHFSQSTPVYVLHPKQDLHGLGYDPFKHAPEFREKKRSRLSGNRELGHRKAFSIKDNLFSSKSGKVAPGFGIGALEELDDEDEDVYASAIEFEDTYDVQEVEEPSGSSIGNKLLLSGKEKGVLPGFKVASNSEMQLERFNPPVIPKGFVPHHKFPGPLVVENRPSEPPPPEVSPPEDNNLKVLIEGVATLVARCGKLFEDISKEKHQSNPLFSFLGGGKGHDYYARKLWEEQCKRNDQTKLQLAGKSSSSVQKMTAENRGRILGERPLERSSNDSGLPNTSADVQLQVNLADTFTRPSSYIGLPEIAKPFKDNPEKQERFEQFLKQKYQGGLRSTDSGGASSMSEAARARERLDFEAAAEAMEKAKWGKEMQPSAENFMDMLAVGGMQFTSGGLEQAKVSQAVDPKLKKMYPKREEFQWRPSPILCKRFDLIDPYMGKPPPAPRMRSKMDSLIFTTDSTKATKSEETVAANREAFVSRSDTLGTSKEVIEEETEVEVEVENVERPVDLYKAIFSDDSDGEGQETILNQVEEDPQNKMEAASKTLNRLIADDFLESLGKELGLEVPRDMPYSNNKARDNVSQKESGNSSKENNNYLAVESGSFSIPGTISGTSIIQERPHNKPYKAQESGLLENDLVLDNLPRHRQARSGSSSSDDGRSRHSRRHKNSGSDSETVSSGDHHNRRSKGKRESSREKSSSSRKRSKHHKHRSSGSSSKSRHSTDKDRAAGKRDKRKRRD